MSIQEAIYPNENEEIPTPQKETTPLVVSDDVPASNDPQMEQDEVREITQHVSEQLTSKELEELESQFAQTHYFPLETEQLEYTMVIPPQRVTASAQEWAVFIGGFSSIKETYKKEMLDLARIGKPVLFLSPDKGVAPSTLDEDYFNVHAPALPNTMRNKAVAVDRLLEHLHISNANIIGHSQGGAVASALVGMRPQIAKRLLLDNPAGLIDDNSVRGLLHRVHDEAKVETTDAQTANTWIKQIKKLLKIPLWRATKEIPGIAHADIRPILEQLKNKRNADGTGPEIILINANNDKIFPKEDIEHGLGEHPHEQYIDRWVMYADKNATHGKFNREDGELYAQLMDNWDERASIIRQIVTEQSPTKKR